MRFETVAARHLEIDFFLEQGRVLAQQLARRSAQGLGQGAEPVVEGGNALDPADQAFVRVLLAFLVKHPMAAGNLGQGQDLVGPCGDARHLV